MTATGDAKGRVVRAAVSNITFMQPVKVGDVVCCYTDIVRVGRTSMTLHVEVLVLRQGQGDRVKVTEPEFVFVAVNDNGRPRPLPNGDRPMPGDQRPYRRHCISTTGRRAFLLRALGLGAARFVARGGGSRSTEAIAVSGVLSRFVAIYSPRRARC